MESRHPDLKRFEHGLVLGKFYPPHAGHHFLIREAAKQCRRVTVVVLAADAESIALADRVAWLRAEHVDDPSIIVEGDVDNHPVDFDDPAVWDAHVATTAAVVVRAQSHLEIDAAAIDAVFSSEPYGVELARRFGAASIVVDLERAAHVVSGTALRSDLVAHWRHLAPATQTGLARRIVVLGSESSGTTTLAHALASALRGRGGVFASTAWVPEYGRDFTWTKLHGLRAQRLVGSRPESADDNDDTDATAVGIEDLCWTHGDFVHIAERQAESIDEAARSGSPVVVADTDAFATGVWHERYQGFRSDEVEAVGARRYGDLYLLTDVAGVEFEDDGIRDGQHLREWMQDTFLGRLAALGLNVAVLSGSTDERLAAAVGHVDRLLASITFTDPLG